MGERTEEQCRGECPRGAISDVFCRWGKRRLLMSRWMQKYSGLEPMQRHLR